MVATARPEVKLVTGKINGQDVTVPAGTTILEAGRMAGIEIPNLCYQPLLRPWGSCRICTVEVLGKRGGLIESCATPLAEGAEVLTHSPDVMQARQYILQMYLIDHALDCPTCDKSGECYLQDNTYLHNINANPYRRPKMAHAYEHFSDTIDYKWDRCIMCNRCTRVCDEMVGAIAIENTSRSLEASIAPAFGKSLEEGGTCTNCGMCIAVCPVGALTDRHFGHHPWELDSVETICGFCDVGCTLNVETNKGLVRRITHLWERGLNQGYTCERGKWGYEQIQNPDRLPYPRLTDAHGTYEATWDEAIAAAAEGLAHHQGDRFAALASPDSTNEEAYLLQLFARAVMGSNNIDRYLTPGQSAVAGAVRAALGRDVANTNNLQELFTDAKAALVVGPDLGKTEPVASYFFYHARLYREARIVVISRDESALAHRADLWLRPNPGTVPALLAGIARQILDMGLAALSATAERGFADWETSLAAADGPSVERETGVPLADIRRAAEIYATGGAGLAAGRPDGAFAPSLIYQTVAHQSGPQLSGLADARPSVGGNGTGAGRLDGTGLWYHARESVSDDHGDPAAIAAACANLAILTGNLGRPGGGVAALRGPANYQGVTDMGATPDALPGGVPVADPIQRALFAEAWLPRWADRASTGNGFVPVRELPSTPGRAAADLPAAIERGEVTALYVEDALQGRFRALDPALEAALPKLGFLVVATAYTDSPLSRHADVVLPLAQFIEKDGSFTNFDRTVQRVRAAVPAMSEARSGGEIVAALARRFGYDLRDVHPAQVMAEIARLVPAYGGVTYARLERNGLNVPAPSFLSPGTPILTAADGADGAATMALTPRLLSVPAAAGGTMTAAAPSAPDV